MLSDALKQFSKSYDQLWREIRIVDGSQGIENLYLSHEDISILERLVCAKVFHLKAFEILVRCAPTNALNLLAGRYLSVDLSNSSKDHVADLEIMLSDISEILGRDKLEEVLSSSKFLSDNKKNPRVMDAIEFARGGD